MKTVITLIIIYIFTICSIVSNHKIQSDLYFAKLKDGKIVMVYQGVIMTADVVLDNGTQIKTDGSVVKKDGTKLSLKEGECVDKEGRMPTKK